MFSKEFILNQLREMGVPQDRPVTIHTSLKSIGEVEGRGEGLLDLLIEYVTAKGGLLCVPTHTHDYLYAKDLITLDLLKPFTQLGAFPTIAVNDPRGVRSINPSHSMAIFGDKEKAREFAAADNGIKTCTSPSGCYGRLYDEDGYVLLVGVDHNKNSFLHCAEEMLNMPNRLTNEEIETRIRHLDGSIELFSLRTYRPIPELGDVSSRFSKFEPAFKKNGCITYGKIGNADTQLCSCRGMVAVMRMILERSNGKDVLADELPIDEKYYN